jgi:hypothetical protein
MLFRGDIFRVQYTRLVILEKYSSASTGRWEMGGETSKKVLDPVLTFPS